MYQFYPEEHKYATPSNHKTISVSTIIGLFSNPFDNDYWTKYKAWEIILFPMEPTVDARKAKFKKLRESLGYNWKRLGEDSLFTELSLKYPELKDIVDNDIQKQINKEWRSGNLKSTEKGNKYHETMERESIKKGTEYNSFDKRDYPVIVPYTWEEGVKKQNIDLNTLETGYYPELIVHHESIIGQIDRPWINKEDKIFYLKDYKSNKKLDRENRFQKLKYPLDHLDDCKLNIYSLQLNLYAWLLSKKGYSCGGLAINWYNEEIVVKDMQEEVESMIMHYKLNKHLYE